MKSASLAALVCLKLFPAVATWDVFEPPDFNVTTTLLDKGVDITSIVLYEEILLSFRRLDPCSIACTAIVNIFGETKVSFDKHPDQGSNQQNEVLPRCTLTPRAASEVSIMMLLSRLIQYPFTVKSGGHAAFRGASSIEGGITVALAGLSTLKLSTDKKTVVVGSGNRWYHVYSYLEPYGVTVVGGRAATVGVGGLTLTMLPLGGGISYHTNKYGLACDNVASYEVVTRSGRIVTASVHSYPDLYWALRGGGNNFGIVTSFNYETLAQGLMWGGSRQYNGSKIPKLLEAFVKTTIAAEEDTEAAHALSITAYACARIASTLLEYTSPIDTASPPAILRDYLSIMPVQDNLANSSQANLMRYLSDTMPSGSRTTMWSASFKLDGPLIIAIAEHLFTTAAEFLSKFVSVSIQAFSVPTLRAMQKESGNPLRLKPVDGPLFHILLYSAWNSSSDDAAMMRAAESFIDTARAMAKERRLDRDYIYMLYASGYQEVIPSYGAENQKKLMIVATKYDPKGILHGLRPGGFKLDGAPFGTEV